MIYKVKKRLYKIIYNLLYKDIYDKNIAIKTPFKYYNKDNCNYAKQAVYNALKDIQNIPIVYEINHKSYIVGIIRKCAKIKDDKKHSQYIATFNDIYFFEKAEFDTLIYDNSAPTNKFKITGVKYKI